MLPKRLMVVVSDHLRKSLGPTDGPLPLGPVTLLVHRGKDRLDRFNPSEKQWEDGLLSELTTVLQDKAGAVVRVAVHQTTCFEAQLQNYSALSFDPPIQARYVKEEDELKATTDIHDLQVWGFSRIDGMAPIWDALRSIVAVFKSSMPAESTRFLLGQALDEAFLDALAQDPYELWTNCRHHVLGFFVATRLNLEVAAEMAGRDQSQATALFQETLRGLEARIADAKCAVDNTARTVKGQRRDYLLVCKEMRDHEVAVVEVLRDLPQFDDLRTATRDFNGWLSRLDESLERLREGVR